MSGRIVKVSGPLVVAEGMEDANMADVVRVGKQQLIGEILNMTRRLAPPFRSMRRRAASAPAPRSRRPACPSPSSSGPACSKIFTTASSARLTEIRDRCGETIARGVQVPALNREKKWAFTPTVKKGDKLVRRRRDRHRAGDERRSAQDHGAARNGGHRQGDPIAANLPSSRRVCVLETEKGEEHLSLMQKWPVRVARPYDRKFTPSQPAYDRPAHHRHHVPAGQGRHGRRSRPVRLGQDRRAAPAGQVVGRRYRRLHRLRRARQRDDRRSDASSRSCTTPAPANP